MFQLSESVEIKTFITNGLKSFNRVFDRLVVVLKHTIWFTPKSSYNQITSLRRFGLCSYACKFNNFRLTINCFNLMLYYIAQWFLKSVRKIELAEQ